MNSHRRTWLATGLLALTAAVPAFAHGGGHVGGPGGGAPPTEEDAIGFVCKEASEAVEAMGMDECD